MAATAERRTGGPGTWLARHGETAVAALGRLAAQPLSTLLTVLVIAITLALPAGLHLGVKNAAQLSGGWESAVDFSVYLDMGTAEDDARRLAGIIESRADVERVEFISATEALADFKAGSGFGDALDALDDNPLPHTLVVRPAVAGNDSLIELLREELANLPETDLVQLDTAWVQRFNATLDLIRRVILITALLLGAAVIIVIGNTIRLDIQNRRDEIVVTKLIGASAGFIRRPFLYSGLLYGIGGGLLALVLVAVSLWLTSDGVARLAGLYGSGFRLSGLDWRESLTVLGTGAFLGWFGSWFAAARHMRRIEPR
ncbi:permease-like cell division protein FtsX [Lentisalinibacter salinarum]|uniref:permease-like cell division protein FtsX n=1 Tax=Lentisalinibacter salinarum TaxID=2992239 RepID=UPI003869149F